MRIVGYIPEPKPEEVKETTEPKELEVEETKKTTKKSKD